MTAKTEMYIRMMASTQKMEGKASMKDSTTMRRFGIWRSRRKTRTTRTVA